jgi:hypothetical protein
MKGFLNAFFTPILTRTPAAQLLAKTKQLYNSVHHEVAQRSYVVPNSLQRFVSVMVSSDVQNKPHEQSY